MLDYSYEMKVEGHEDEWTEFLTQWDPPNIHRAVQQYAEDWFDPADPVTEFVVEVSHAGCLMRFEVSIRAIPRATVKQVSEGCLVIRA